MTKDRVWQYARELGYLVKQAYDAKGAIDAMTSDIEISKATNNTKKAEQVIGQRASARTQLETITGLAMTKANRKDLEGCERLLQQLQVRLRELDELDQETATYEARFELAVAMQEFAGDDGAKMRADAEGQLDKLRERVSTQLRLAADLVPDKPVILSL